MPYQSALHERSFPEVERAIRGAVYTPVGTLAATAWVTSEPVSFAERRHGRKLILKPGDQWSEATFDCAWFYFAGTVLRIGSAESDIVLLIDLNGEGWRRRRVKRRPVLGLTSVSPKLFAAESTVELGKRVVPFRTKAAGGGKGSHRIMGGGRRQRRNVRRPPRQAGTLKEASIAIW